MLWLRIFLVVLWSAFLSWSCLQYYLENRGNVRQIDLRCNNLFVTCHSIRNLHHFFSCSKPANKCATKKPEKKFIQTFSPSTLQASWTSWLDGFLQYVFKEPPYIPLTSHLEASLPRYDPELQSPGKKGDWPGQGVFDLGIPTVSVVCWRG